MYNLYGRGQSTIRKYTMIVCRALGSNEDGLFVQFIHTPSGDRLHNVIEKFRDITALLNIAGAIDDSHIPLSARPSRRYNPMPQDFYNRKHFHNIVLQAVCNTNRMFGNVCAGQPGGIHDARQFAVSSLAKQLSRRQILAESIIHLSGMEIQPYLLGDIAHPSRPYMLKNFIPGDPAMVDKIRYGLVYFYGLLNIINVLLIVWSLQIFIMIFFCFTGLTPLSTGDVW